jgi:hypothetical protein
LSGLDSFMIKELLWMKMRDQLIRNNKEYIDDISKFKHIDSTNLVILQSLIKYNNGKLPSYQQLGSDGSYALEIILTHFDVKNINEIFPYIIVAIKNNTFYNSENVLYQIDRNNIDDKNLYLYNKKLKKFDIKKTNKLLHKNIGYFQYYGGMDINDLSTRKTYYWPYFPNRDMKIVTNLLNDLCLPIRNPLKSHIIDCKVEEFIKIALKYR